MSRIDNPFIISGTVKRYSGNGRKLGYPTANIEVAADAAEGVFVGFTTLRGHKLPSVIFIGTPVTMEDPLKRAESYILDFPDQDLYGEQIKMEIVKKLRDNRKFDSQAALIEQMRADEAKSRQFFGLLNK